MMGIGKESVTTVENLFETIITKSEEPYNIPNNWIWLKLVGLSAVISKGTTPKGGKDSYKELGVNFLRIENLTDDGFIDKTNIMHIDEQMHRSFLKRSILQVDDVLISIAGTLGKTAIVTNEDLPLNTNQALAFVRLKNSKLVIPKYIRYCLSTPIIQEMLLSQRKVTAIPNLTLEIIGNCAIPLAPLLEQQRIVESIESLFRKLDSVKELSQSALDSFGIRKSSILHQAFTGELTKKWRDENGMSISDWTESFVGKYADTKYGYTESANIKKVGPKFLRITDIQDDSVNWNSVPYCTITDKDLQIYSLKKGDIVVARTGATTGKSFLVKEVDNAVFASYLIRINVVDKETLSEEYLYNFMSSSFYWNQISDLSQGIAQPGVNATKLKEIIIPIPPLPEQKEIVRILDRILREEEKAKELTNVIGKIDQMKKAILARAFRGELGTNHPTEESAIELLKEILIER